MNRIEISIPLILTILADTLASLSFLRISFRAHTRLAFSLFEHWLASLRYLYVNICQLLLLLLRVSIALKLLSYTFLSHSHISLMERSFHCYFSFPLHIDIFLTHIHIRCWISFNFISLMRREYYILLCTFLWENAIRAHIETFISWEITVRGILQLLSLHNSFLYQIIFLSYWVTLYQTGCFSVRISLLLLLKVSSELLVENVTVRLLLITI